MNAKEVEDRMKELTKKSGWNTPVAAKVLTDDDRHPPKYPIEDIRLEDGYIILFYNARRDI